jgi:hypothetical protein
MPDYTGDAKAAKAASGHLPQSPVYLPCRYFFMKVKTSFSTIT